MLVPDAQVLFALAYAVLFFAIGLAISWRQDAGRLIALLMLAFIALYVQLRSGSQLSSAGWHALTLPENWRRLAVPTGFAAAIIMVLLKRSIWPLQAQAGQTKGSRRTEDPPEGA